MKNSKAPSNNFTPKPVTLPRRALTSAEFSQLADVPMVSDKEQNVEIRSHELTLREGELDSRLCDRERTVEDLNLRLRKLTLTLRKQQATVDAQTHGFFPCPDDGNYDQLRGPASRHTPALDRLLIYLSIPVKI
jgi:hypothetical protein